MRGFGWEVVGYAAACLATMSLSDYSDRDNHSPTFLLLKVPSALLLRRTSQGKVERLQVGPVGLLWLLSVWRVGGRVGKLQARGVLGCALGDVLIGFMYISKVPNPTYLLS